MFTTLLEPENAVLYHRIVEAVFGVLAPALAGIIAEGEAEGVFDVGDPALAAEALLGLGNGRRALVIAALDRRAATSSRHGDDRGASAPKRRSPIESWACNWARRPAGSAGRGAGHAGRLAGGR